jgi:hypothetical protein
MEILKMKYQIALVAALLMSNSVYAETGSLKTFKAGDRVKAAEINGNFTSLDNKIDALKQSVTFAGLDDIYSGTAEQQAGTSAEALAWDQMKQVYSQVRSPSSNLRSASSSSDAACTAANDCVINGNRATVTCNGEQGKLASLLKSPDAKAAFLIVEVIGNCVEDQLLVTRGAAFFSKNNTGSISAPQVNGNNGRAIVCAAAYCHFGNITVNGQFESVRGAILVLQENVAINRDLTTLYAGEGSFTVIGKNIDMSGWIVAESGANIRVYGPDNTAQQVIVRNTDLTARPGNGYTSVGLKADILQVTGGSRVELSNDLYSLENSTLNLSTSAFEFGGVVVNHGSYLLLGGNSVSIGGLTIADNSHARLKPLGSFVMADAAAGTYPEKGKLSLSQNSTLSLEFSQDISIRSIGLREGTAVNLAPTNNAVLSVTDLSVNHGGKVTANYATSKSMTVNGSVLAYRGAMIQNGVVGLGGSATTEVSQACAWGNVIDLCE